jgi:hypothetical protein
MNVLWVRFSSFHIFMKTRMLYCSMTPERKPCIIFPLEYFLLRKMGTKCTVQLTSLLSCYIFIPYS